MRRHVDAGFGTMGSKTLNSASSWLSSLQTASQSCIACVRTRRWGTMSAAAAAAFAYLSESIANVAESTLPRRDIQCDGERTVDACATALGVQFGV